MNCCNIYEKAKNIIEKVNIKLESLPSKIPTNFMVDAPLIGNGDLGIAVSGDGNKHEFFIGKNDFWQQDHLGETLEQRMDKLFTEERGLGFYTGSGPLAVGRVCININELEDCSYKQEQDILHAEIKGTFIKQNTEVEFCSWVHPEKNILITEITCKGQKDINIRVSHYMGTRHYGGYNQAFGHEGKDIWFTRSANSINEANNRIAAVYTKVLCPNEVLLANSPYVIDDTITFRISTGQTAAVITMVSSDCDVKGDIEYFISSETRFALKRKTYLEYIQKKVSKITSDEIINFKKVHAGWWRDFWSESYVDLGEPALEKFYYSSHYILASCMRKGKVQPGIFGNWITTDNPEWAGSYTLNYNYEAPYWGLYSSNHINIAESYCDPLLDILPIGRMYAQKLLGCKGICLPVSIGPWGTVTGNIFWNQKSNAAYSVVNLLMHYYHTMDIEYAQKIYGYIKEVVEFWEDFLTFENGRYVIYNDAIHECFVSKDINPILSIALIKMVYEGVITISKELKTDEDKRGKWEHIKNNISKFPTYERNGKIVFRLTESGMDWSDVNTLAIQNIFPAGCIGLDSDPEILEIARNTFQMMNRWDDGNGFPTYYTAGVRIGYNPEEILVNLKQQCEKYGMKNSAIFHGGGGIEDCSAVPSCINEMLFQSHEGILRFFPVWPKHKDASFENLRGYGSFLAAGKIQDGKIIFASIRSEKGKDLKIQNPWNEREVTVYRNGIAEDTVKGEIISLQTHPGDIIMLHS